MTYYAGEYCILHFDQEPPLDTGRGRKPIVAIGFENDKTVDNTNGVFEPLSSGDFSLGSVDLNGGSEYPTYRALRVLSDRRELEFSNDAFYLDCWVNFEVMRDRHTLCAYGGATGETYWYIGAWFGDTFGIPRRETIEFYWFDRFSARRYVQIELPVGTFTAGSWQYFVFQYDPGSEYFSVWVDGQLAGSFLGPSLGSLYGPWDGIYVRNSRAETGRSLSIGGPPSTSNINVRGGMFIGLMDEFRFTYQQTFYPSLQSSIPVPTTRLVDPEPLPDPGNPEPAEIFRPFINGVNKVNIEKAKFAPALCGVRTDLPEDFDGTHEGQLYFFRPDPDYPKVFMYIYLNIQGDGEDPIFEWVPVSMPVIGKKFFDAGTKWKSRKGTTFGEPF